MKKRKYFLGLMIAEIVLFVLCCFSIIYCVINAPSMVPDDKRVEHTMSFVFLFLHMIVIAVLFFYTLKAYLAGSSFIQIVTTNENGEKNRKTVVVCSVLAGIFALIAVYFVTVISGIPSFGNMFSLGLQFALANAGFTVSSLCLFLVFYRPDEIKK